MGTFFSMLHTTGATLRDMSIKTVPPTAGVSTRRRAPILWVKAKVDSDDTHTRVAIRGSPPAWMAFTQMPTKATLEPTNSVWPPPTRPSCIA